MKHKELKDLKGRDFLREMVRIRDEQTCQKCGKIWLEGKRKFDVHHLDESQEGFVGRTYANNKDMDKMITYCHKCHLNLHIVVEKMRKGIWKNNYVATIKRNKAIFKMRELGVPVVQIASVMNMNRSRVYQILNNDYK